MRLFFLLLVCTLCLTTLFMWQSTFSAVFFLAYSHIHHLLFFLLFPVYLFYWTSVRDSVTSSSIGVFMWEINTTTLRSKVKQCAEVSVLWHSPGQSVPVTCSFQTLSHMLCVRVFTDVGHWEQPNFALEKFGVCGYILPCALHVYTQTNIWPPVNTFIKRMSSLFPWCRPNPTLPEADFSTQGEQSEAPAVTSLWPPNISDPFKLFSSVTSALQTCGMLTDPHRHKRSLSQCPRFKVNN